MIELKLDSEGKYLPIVNKNKEKVCTPEELIWFFKNCFGKKERKFKIILLTQLGCECRVHEACAINLRDFHEKSMYRKVDILIQKKSYSIKKEKKCECCNGKGHIPTAKGSFSRKCPSCEGLGKIDIKKTKGSNEIVTKYIPEAIAAHLRTWIKDNWTTIQHNNGFIFPPNQIRKEYPYCDPKTVTSWFAAKRRQLTKYYPERGFNKVMGWRYYHNKNNKLRGKSPLYVWRTHMMKAFAGTYAYLLTNDAKFVQAMLEHEKLRTTEKHYIDSAAILRDRPLERIKNTMFDQKFYEEITTEEEKIPAVWDEDVLPITIHKREFNGGL